MNSQKLYFKITNKKEKHHEFQYYNGLNELIDEFNDNPNNMCIYNNCYFPNGLYFTDIDHILEFLEFGVYLREVILPTDDPDFKMVQDGDNKWSANKIILGKKRNLCDVSTFEYLIDNGADILAADNCAIRWACTNRHLEIVKFLISEGANTRAKDNYSIRYASANGYLEIVQLLISNSAMVHAKDNYAIKWASANGHLDVVKVLVEAGADIHAEQNFAVKIASENGHLDVVQYLISCGANIYDGDNYTQWILKMLPNF